MSVSYSARHVGAWAPPLLPRRVRKADQDWDYYALRKSSWGQPTEQGVDCEVLFHKDRDANTVTKICSLAKNGRQAFDNEVAATSSASNIGIGPPFVDAYYGANPGTGEQLGILITGMISAPLKDVLNGMRPVSSAHRRVPSCGEGGKCPSVPGHPVFYLQDAERLGFAIAQLIWEVGIVHMDLHCGNIYVTTTTTEDGGGQEIRIIDFGRIIAATEINKGFDMVAKGWEKPAEDDVDRQGQYVKGMAQVLQKSLSDVFKEIDVGVMRGVFGRGEAAKMKAAIMRPSLDLQLPTKELKNVY